MNTNNDKYEFSDIIKEADKRGLIKSYEEFTKTDDSKKYALSEEEVAYYTSLNKEQYKIGEVTNEELTRFKNAYRKYLSKL